MGRVDPVPAPPNLLSLADNPRLPALVQKLPAPVLSRLIGAVGIEDAGPLVAMTTPQQLCELFDDVLWQTPAPGLPARFSVDEFLRWLEVLNEESVAFAAERLQALGEQFLDLLVVLGQIEGIGRAPRLLAPDGPRTLTIKARLAALEQDQPAAFAVRMGELVYLANVLMSGIASPRLTEAEAPNVALAICNIGAERDGGTANALSSPPGLVGLFRIGWHTLCRLPPLAARRLVSVLRDPVIRERLATRQWILAEVDLAIADLVNRVDLAEFKDIEESLGIVSLVVEAEAVHYLNALISELPRVPATTDHTEQLDTSTRDIESIDDLARVERFLARLPEQVKL